MSDDRDLYNITQGFQYARERATHAMHQEVHQLVTELLTPWPAYSYLEELRDGARRAELMDAIHERLVASLVAGEPPDGMSDEAVLEELRYATLRDSKVAVWELFFDAVNIGLEDQRGKNMHLQQAEKRWTDVCKAVVRTAPRALPPRSREECTREAMKQVTLKAIQWIRHLREVTAKQLHDLNFARQDLMRQARVVATVSRTLPSEEAPAPLTTSPTLTAQMETLQLAAGAQPEAAAAAAEGGEGALEVAKGWQSLDPTEQQEMRNELALARNNQALLSRQLQETLLLLRQERAQFERDREFMDNEIKRQGQRVVNLQEHLHGAKDTEMRLLYGNGPGTDHRLKAEHMERDKLLEEATVKMREYETKCQVAEVEIAGLQSDLRGEQATRTAQGAQIRLLNERIKTLESQAEKVAASSGKPAPNFRGPVGEPSPANTDLQRALEIMQERCARLQITLDRERTEHDQKVEELQSMQRAERARLAAEKQSILGSTLEAGQNSLAVEQRKFDDYAAQVGEHMREKQQRNAQLEAANLLNEAQLAQAYAKLDQVNRENAELKTKLAQFASQALSSWRV